MWSQTFCLYLSSQLKLLTVMMSSQIMWGWWLWMFSRTKHEDGCRLSMKSGFTSFPPTFLYNHTSTSHWKVQRSTIQHLFPLRDCILVCFPLQPCSYPEAGDCNVCWNTGTVPTYNVAKSPVSEVLHRANQVCLTTNDITVVLNKKLCVMCSQHVIY